MNCFIKGQCHKIFTRPICFFPKTNQSGPLVEMTAQFRIWLLFLADTVLALYNTIFKLICISSCPMYIVTNDVHNYIFCYLIIPLKTAMRSWNKTLTSSLKYDIKWKSWVKNIKKLWIKERTWDKLLHYILLSSVNVYHRRILQHRNQGSHIV